MSVTANQLIERQRGDKQRMPVAASTRIYQGTLVFRSATGYADDDTASGVSKFAGIAVGEADNSAGAAGDIAVELWVQGVFELTGSGFTQADVGKEVWATDNYTIGLSTVAAGAVFIGCVEEYVSSTRLRVRIKVQQHVELVDKRSQTAVTDTATITIAQLLTKILDGTPTAAATYTLPTAALLVAGIPGCQVGDSFDFCINNKSGGANTITVAAGAGGTADGTLTVAQHVIRDFSILVTNVGSGTEAYFVYGKA